MRMTTAAYGSEATASGRPTSAMVQAAAERAAEAVLVEEREHYESCDECRRLRRGKVGPWRDPRCWTGRDIDGRVTLAMRAAGVY